MRSRRGQNQRDSQGRQKPERERPEIYLSEDACLLCNEHCGNNKGDKSICQLCSEPVKQQGTKLSLMKSKLSH